MFLILTVFTNLVGIASFIFYLLQNKKVREELKSILPFLILVFISSIYEIIGTNFFNIDSKYWFRLYTLLEFLVLFYFFKKILKKNHKVLFNLILSFFLAVFIILLFYWNSINSYTGDSYLSVIETFAVFLFTILWIKELFVKFEKESILEYSIFYFISGLLIYLSGTLILYLLSPILKLKYPELFYGFWVLNVFFNFLLRSIIIFVIWREQRK